VVALPTFMPEIAEFFQGASAALIQPNGIFDQIDPVTKKLRYPTSIERISVDGCPGEAPLYGKIAAGAPLEAIPSEGKLSIPDDILGHHPEGFFLKVVGESMNRVLPNGCFAFIDPDVEVSDNDLVAVHVNGHDATIKRILRGNTSVILKPDSMDPAFSDMIFDYSKPDTETVTLFGRVVWFRSQYGGRL
jgi:repressor LexA